MHSLLRNDDPSLQISRENWTPVPDAILDVEFPSLVCEGLPYDAELQWFSPTLLLARAKEAQSQTFAAVFAQLDAKKMRSVSIISEYTAQGLEPDPYEVNLLTQHNMTAEQNREILQGIMTTGIPDAATRDDAQAIIHHVLTVAPWEPPIAKA